MKKQEQSEQTDKVIFKEYIKLLKNDDKPTIIKLCSNAKINRETFYRHFETKQNFERMFVKYVFLKYNQISEDKNFLFNIRCYIEIIKQYKNIIVKLLNSPDIREEILNEIKIRLNDKALDESKKAKHIFLIGGINSIIYAYINDEITSENLIGVLELYLK